MNKEFDICWWCVKYHEHISGIGWCDCYKIIRSRNSESCDKGELSLWGKEHIQPRIERVEKGGTRESEFFE